MSLDVLFSKRVQPAACGWPAGRRKPGRRPVISEETGDDSIQSGHDFNDSWKGQGPKECNVNLDYLLLLLQLHF